MELGADVVVTQSLSHLEVNVHLWKKMVGAGAVTQLIEYLASMREVLGSFP